jgi:hypothetical protein
VTGGRVAAALLVVLGAVPSCGGPSEDFATRVDRAWCARLAACDRLDDYAFTDVSACEDAFAGRGLLPVGATCEGADTPEGDACIETIEDGPCEGPLDLSVCEAAC